MLVEYMDLPFVF